MFPYLNRKTPLHIYLFFFGVVYYLCVPIFIGFADAFINFPAMERWHSEFDAIKSVALFNYACIVMAYIVAFTLGSYSLHLFRNSSVCPNKNYFVSKRCLNFSCVAVVFMLLTVFLAIKNRGILFTGYQTYEGGLLGPLATINVISLYFLVYLSVKQKYRTDYYLFSVNLFLTSILLLGLGSRMYVLVPVVALLIFKLRYSSSAWNVRKVVIWAVIGAFSMLLIGAWRIGASLNFEFLTYLFFSESIFTWWSSATFLQHNTLDIFEYPDNFISSFYNFLPAFLFENKAQLISKLNDKFFYEAPLGADSIFVSIQGNFGYGLGIVFLYLLGFFYSIVLHLSARFIFYRVYYILIISVIPFQFFRDNFGIINKQIFWNMFILPMLVIFLLTLVYYFLPRKSKVII